MSETKAPDIPAEIREAIRDESGLLELGEGYTPLSAEEAMSRIASLALAHGRQEAAWQPIETAPKDDAVILRPHYIWGAMDVRRGPVTTIDGKTQPWINGDMTTAWPEEAFLPYWMPRPANPAVAKEGTER